MIAGNYFDGLDDVLEMTLKNNCSPKKLLRLSTINKKFECIVRNVIFQIVRNNDVICTSIELARICLLKYIPSFRNFPESLQSKLEYCRIDLIARGKFEQSVIKESDLEENYQIELKIHPRKNKAVSICLEEIVCSTLYSSTEFVFEAGKCVRYRAEGLSEGNVGEESLQKAFNSVTVAEINAFLERRSQPDQPHNIFFTHAHHLVKCLELFREKYIEESTWQ